MESHAVDDAAETWADYSVCLGTSLHVVIEPENYLGDERDESRPFEPSQQSLDKSIRWAVATYQRILRESLERNGTTDAEPTHRSYVPPSVYQRGGAATAPLQLIEFVQSVGELVANGIAEEVIGAIFWEAVEAFQEHLDKVGFSRWKRRIPPHSPEAVRLMCAGHASENYRAFRPRHSQSHYRLLTDSRENYPLLGGGLVVVVPVQEGSLIYVVDSRLELGNHFLADGKGGRDLDSGLWPGTIAPLR